MVDASAAVVLQGADCQATGGVSDCAAAISTAPLPTKLVTRLRSASCHLSVSVCFPPQARTNTARLKPCYC